MSEAGQVVVIRRPGDVCDGRVAVTLGGDKTGSVWSAAVLNDDETGAWERFYPSEVLVPAPASEEHADRLDVLLEHVCMRASRLMREAEEHITEARRFSLRHGLLAERVGQCLANARSAAMDAHLWQGAAVAASGWLREVRGDG